MKPGPRPVAWLVLAAWAGACRSSPPADARTIVIVQAEGPVSLDPNASNEDASGNVLGNVFEPLVAMDANLRLVPALAESWYTPDATTWVFKLRKGARWHDGREVRPAEVVSSLERARSDPQSRRRPELSQITAIGEGGPGEIVLKTRAPFGALTSQLAQVAISRPARDGHSFPVGTGPYRIQSFSPGGDTALTPAAAESPLHPLLFRVVQDSKTQLQMLRDGRCQIVPYLSPTDAAAIKTSPKLRLIRRQGLSIAFLGMDYARTHTPYVNLKKNPFRDIRVRRALASIIDRDALLATALDGRGAPLDQLVVPEAFGYASGVPAPKQDVALARRLMAEAGLPDGFVVTLDYEGIAMKGSMDRIAAVLAIQLGRIGIHLKPRALLTQELLHRVESRDTSLYVLSWVGTSGDFGSTAEFLLHTPVPGRGTDNGGGYSSPEADALIDAASATLDPAARLAILRQLEERVRDDVPVIPLLRREDAYGVAAEVSFEPRLDREIRGVSLVIDRR